MMKKPPDPSFFLSSLPVHIPPPALTSTSSSLAPRIISRSPCSFQLSCQPLIRLVKSTIRSFRVTQFDHEFLVYSALANVRFHGGLGMLMLADDNSHPPRVRHSCDWLILPHFRSAFFNNKFEIGASSASIVAVPTILRQTNTKMHRCKGYMYVFCLSITRQVSPFLIFRRYANFLLVFSQRVDFSLGKLNPCEVSETIFCLSNLSLCTNCGLRVRIDTQLLGFHFHFTSSSSCVCLLSIWVPVVCMWEFEQLGAVLLMMLLRCMACDCRFFLTIPLGFALLGYGGGYLSQQVQEVVAPRFWLAGLVLVLCSSFKPGYLVSLFFNAKLLAFFLVNAVRQLVSTNLPLRFGALMTSWMCHLHPIWSQVLIPLVLLIEYLKQAKLLCSMVKPIVTKIQYYEIKAIIVASIYTIESIMVSEMLDELTLVCVSKTPIQSAFGPRTLHMFTLLCLVLIRKQFKCGILFTICCFTMILMCSLSRIGLKFFVSLLGLFMSHGLLINLWARFAKVFLFSCLVKERMMCIFFLDDSTVFDNDAHEKKGITMQDCRLAPAASSLPLMICDLYYCIIMGGCRLVLKSSMVTRVTPHWGEQPGHTPLKHIPPPKDMSMTKGFSETLNIYLAFLYFMNLLSTQLFLTPRPVDRRSISQVKMAVSMGSIGGRSKIHCLLQQARQQVIHRMFTKTIPQRDIVNWLFFYHTSILGVTYIQNYIHDSLTVLLSYVVLKELVGRKFCFLAYLLGYFLSCLKASEGTVEDTSSAPSKAKFQTALGPSTWLIMAHGRLLVFMINWCYVEFILISIKGDGIIIVYRHFLSLIRGVAFLQNY